MSLTNKLLSYPQAPKEPEPQLYVESGLYEPEYEVWEEYGSSMEFEDVPYETMSTRK